MEFGIRQLLCIVKVWSLPTCGGWEAEWFLGEHWVSVSVVARGQRLGPGRGGGEGVGVNAGGDARPVLGHPQPAHGQDDPLLPPAGDATSASKGSIQRFVITEKAPTRAFSW